MTEAGAASHPPNKDYETSYQQFSTFREETSHGVGDPYFTADAAGALLHVVASLSNYVQRSEQCHERCCQGVLHCYDISLSVLLA